MKDTFWKYTGLTTVLIGTVLMIGSAYYPTPDLRPESFGASMVGLLTGIVLFSLGGVILAKHDEEFMEKVLDRIGKILEFV